VGDGVIDDPIDFESLAQLVVRTADRLFADAAKTNGVPEDVVRAHFRAELVADEDGCRVVLVHLTSDQFMSRISLTHVSPID
jgi:methyl coenzyme M reductase subunit C